MHQKPKCEWATCHEDGTRKGILSSSTPCEGCGQYHSVRVHFCPEHFRAMKVKEACHSLGKLAMGADRPYRLVQVY